MLNNPEYKKRRLGAEIGKLATVCLWRRVGRKRIAAAGNFVPAPGIAGLFLGTAYYCIAARWPRKHILKVFVKKPASFIWYEMGWRND